MIRRLLIAILVLSISLGYGEANGSSSQVTPGPADGADVPTPERAGPVTVKLGSVTVGSGRMAEVALSIHNVPDPGLAGLEVDVNFDPQVVQVQEVLPGDAPWDDNLTRISNQRGSVRLVNAKGAGTSGSFVLARLRIKAVGAPGMTADLTLSNTFFGSADLEKMEVDLVDGHVSIVAPSAHLLQRTDPGGQGGDASHSQSGGLQWLHVEGNKIVDASGRTVVLRGVNIENREWNWRFTESIEFERRAIPEATGAPPAGWGANVILLAVASGPVNRQDQSYLEFLDEMIALARANGAYTFLTYRYPEPNSEQPPMPDQAAEDALAALAARYADEPAVLYGLQVEPHHVSWGQLKPRFISMIDAIRANNPRALIAVPGTQWSRYVHWALTDPIPRDNLVYKVHFYSPSITAEFQYRLSSVAVVYPVILGEFGAGSAVRPRDAAPLLGLAETLGIGWAGWLFHTVYPVMLGEFDGQSMMNVRDVGQLLDLAERRGISWVGWLFHEKGCPCMLSDAADFATTAYGQEIKERLQATAVDGSGESSSLPPAPAPTDTPTPTPTATPAATPTPTPTPTPLPPGQMAVTVSPPSATVAPGESLQLSAAVPGSADQRVTWSLATPTISFQEPFTWQGPHAATIPGPASTVWWDSDAWDTRTDSAHNAVSGKGDGNHIDIHTSDPDPASGRRVNDRYVPGGDGSPGVGVMHLDFEGIIGARLRNPMLITGEKPGVVEFRAPSFNTTGHWWEVAISPASQVLGGDFTAVPSTDDEFAGLQGSGHAPPEDSINFLVIGRNDVPCKTGWEFRMGVNRAVDHETEEHLGPILPMDPAEKDKLYPWRLEYYPDRIEVYADLDEDGALEHLHTFPAQVPWKEVYVQLLGVAYQASKHPQDGDCGAYQGQVRELGWKEVRIGPLKYARTAVYPRDERVERVPQAKGWMSYDLRDTQRSGMPGSLPEQAQKALPQPNPEPYDRYFSLAFCSDADVYGCEEGVSEQELRFELSPDGASGLAHAQLVYDTRGDGQAWLEVNGVAVGGMPGAEGVAAADKEQWVRRSVAVEPGLLKAGENRVRMVMEGNVQMDRLEMEAGYGLAAADGELGSISPEGLYRAPERVAVPVVVEVVARSVAEADVYGVTRLTVMPEPEPEPGPAPATRVPEPTPETPPETAPRPPAQADDGTWWLLALALALAAASLLIAGGAYWIRRRRSNS